MFSICKMKELDLANKRVLIREDFNVPMQNGKITNDTRLRAAVPTIQYALEHHAAVILMSHLGRPEEGVYNEEYSLSPVAEHLSQLLKQPVRLAKEDIASITAEPGDVVLCENVRFLKGENIDDEALAKKMAGICDIFVMDAFATAHRAQASTYGVARFAPIACAGPLLMEELDALTTAFANPKRPVVAVVGGSKISTKLTLLKHLLTKVDQLIVGGGIANTLLAAKGYTIGKSICEKSLLAEAQDFLDQAEKNNVHVPLPEDVVVAKELSANAIAMVRPITSVAPDEMILDIGPQTIANYTALISKTGTIIWNGPVGVFECASFSEGTKAIAQAIADSAAFSLAGGGDTIAAIDQFGVTNKISYISTGGGAFLELIEGRTLPAIEILEQRARV